MCRLVAAPKIELYVEDVQGDHGAVLAPGLEPPRDRLSPRSTVGFREVFGFPTLQNLPFVHLASRVKRAYEGKEVPRHEGWPAQREAIQWLVDQGRDGIYALDADGIKVKPTPFRSYAITDGNHRALALYILGESLIRARLKN